MQVQACLTDPATNCKQPDMGKKVQTMLTMLPFSCVVDSLSVETGTYISVYISV